MKLLLLLPFLLFIACNSAEDRANKISQDYLDQFSSDITENELNEFISKTSKLFDEHNSVELNTVFDLKACYYRGHIKHNGSPEFIKYIDGIVSGSNSNFSLFDQLSSTFPLIGHVKTYKSENNEHIVVFRAYGDQGLNYLEFLLGKKDGKIFILDIYPAISFEYISSSLYEVLQNMKNGDISKGHSDADIISSVRTHMNSGEFEIASETLQSLDRDSPLRDTKIFKLLEINIASQLDDNDYLNRLEDFKTDYGNETGVNLLLVDYYLLKEDFDKTLMCIADVQDRYPDDHILNVIKGTVHSLKGDYVSCVYYYELASEKYPEMMEIHDYLLVAYFNASEYKKGFEKIDFLIGEDYLTLEDANTFLSNSFTDFEDWPDYKEWKSRS
jgi:hypothetical protein